MRQAEQGPPRRQRSQRREVGDHGHRQLTVRSWGLLLLGGRGQRAGESSRAPGLGENQEPGTRDGFGGAAVVASHLFSAQEAAWSFQKCKSDCGLLTA